MDLVTGSWALPCLQYKILWKIGLTAYCVQIVSSRPAMKLCFLAEFKCPLFVFFLIDPRLEEDIRPNKWHRKHCYRLMHFVARIPVIYEGG